jgi:hypothetical protein
MLFYSRVVGLGGDRVVAATEVVAVGVVEDPGVMSTPDPVGTVICGVGEKLPVLPPPPRVLTSEPWPPVDPVATSQVEDLERLATDAPAIGA